MWSLLCTESINLNNQKRLLFGQTSQPEKVGWFYFFSVVDESAAASRIASAYLSGLIG